jgi:pimeloyl-ACP methyl ester carboxylesterase
VNQGTSTRPLTGARGAAALEGLPGLDPAWSRFVSAPDAEGRLREWHVLDNGVEPTRGTLLCVHGNPTWSYLWRGLLAAAPDGWRVVAPDHLGMGFSERTESPRVVAQRVAWSSATRPWHSRRGTWVRR